MHDWKVKFSSFFIAICWYCQYPQFVKQLVSFSQIMGIFNTYDLLPQSYKALPSNDTFCKYWVYETENLQKSTVSITDCLQNAYVQQLSGMRWALDPTQLESLKVTDSSFKG